MSADLEARVKALEDLTQRITQAFIMAPQKPETSASPPATALKFTAVTPEQATQLCLEIVLKGSVYHIVPTKHLETLDFKALCVQIEAAGGKYVKDPGYSHWEVPA